MRTFNALALSVLLLSGCGYDNPIYAPFPNPSETVDVQLPHNVPLKSVGDSIAVFAVVKDASARMVTSPDIIWRSSAPEVATVSSLGTEAVITAVGDGFAFITASVGFTTDTVIVQVRRVVKTVSLTVSSPVVAPGQTAQLTAVALDARGHAIPGATEFTYTTGNAAKARVSSTGLVTALNPVTQVALVATIVRDGFTVSGVTALGVSAPITFDFAAHLLGDDAQADDPLSIGEGVTFFRISGDRILYQLTWSELSGPATSARILGPEMDLGTGDVLVDLPLGTQTVNWGVTNGSFSAADIHSQGGRPPISIDSIVTLLRNNVVSVNVQTQANTKGEIRGQIVGPFR